VLKKQKVAYVGCLCVSHPPTNFKAYDIALLFVRLPLSLLGNEPSVYVSFPNFVRFYAVRVVSKESRRLVIPELLAVLVFSPNEIASLPLPI
jgi:hypothetical protein